MEEEIGRVKKSESQFKAFLDANSIKQILCRIKHPQRNGKIERFFLIYETHRDLFSSIDKFVHWHN